MTFTLYHLLLDMQKKQYVTLKNAYSSSIYFYLFSSFNYKTKQAAEWAAVIQSIVFDHIHTDYWGRGLGSGGGGGGGGGRGRPGFAGSQLLSTFSYLG